VRNDEAQPTGNYSDRVKCQILHLATTLLSGSTRSVADFEKERCLVNAQVKERNCGADASTINGNASVFPPDFLNRKWVDSFRKKFGPLNPTHVVVFGPLGLVAAVVLFLFFVHTIRDIFSSPVSLEFFCLLASAVSFVAVLLDTEFAVPDRSIPVKESKRILKKRDRLHAFAVLVSALFVLGMAAWASALEGLITWEELGWSQDGVATWASGLAGFIIAVVFFALGGCLAGSYLAFTIHVHVCPVEGLPKAFRKYRGCWACTSCGTPFEPTIGPSIAGNL
jgi:hypothetical protein